jgi:hypothetical protein
MANYAITKQVTISSTVETAVASLETLLEAVDTGKTIRHASIIQIEGHKYAAIVI